MTHQIDYGKLMHQAMRRLIHDVLTDIAKDGLPGAHHFFITFRTTHLDVRISDWLRGRYPEEMTIVVQHWFENLETFEDGFTITLNFGNQAEPLYIPYDAIETFVDPSVEFGLRFEEQSGVDAEDDAPTPQDEDADIVQLDAFRKNEKSS